MSATTTTITNYLLNLSTLSFFVKLCATDPTITTMTALKCNNRLHSFIFFCFCFIYLHSYLICLEISFLYQVLFDANSFLLGNPDFFPKYFRERIYIIKSPSLWHHSQGKITKVYGRFFLHNSKRKLKKFRQWLQDQNSLVIT